MIVLNLVPHCDFVRKKVINTLATSLGQILLGL